MGSLKVTLTKSNAGSPEDVLATIAGLGLKKFGDVKMVPDTPSVRGMVFKVKHLVSSEASTQAYKKRVRRKPRSIRMRDAARAKAAKAQKK